MKSSRSIRGFTLIEFSIVIVISGFVLAAAINAYYVYLENLRYHQTLSKMDTIYVSMQDYMNTKGTYPCPSDPSLSFSDPNAGVSNCAAFNALALNTCNASGSMCKTTGARDTLADAETVNNDVVLVGGLPYRTIKQGADLGFTSGTAVQECYTNGTVTAVPCDANSDGVLDSGVYLQAMHAAFKDLGSYDALDGWGYQFTYAVTDQETNSNAGNKFGQGQYGAIDVKTENMVELMTPAGSANLVILSHGDDHNGAWNSQGIQPTTCGSLPGAGGNLDNYNCTYLGTNATFIAGLRSLSTSNAAAKAAHYDDTISYQNQTISKIWDFVLDSAGVPTSDIYNLNLGNVGIGTGSGNMPKEKLQVAGDAMAATTAATAICQGETSPTNSAATNKCFSPQLLGGKSVTLNGETLGTNEVASKSECNPGNSSGDYAITKIDTTVAGLSGSSGTDSIITCTTSLVTPPTTPPSGTLCGTYLGSQLYVTGYSSSGFVCCLLDGTYCAP